MNNLPIFENQMATLKGKIIKKNNKEQDKSYKVLKRRRRLSKKKLGLERFRIFTVRFDFDSHTVDSIFSNRFCKCI